MAVLAGAMLSGVVCVLCISVSCVTCGLLESLLV